jgi:hypothetical protein
MKSSLGEFGGVLADQLVRRSQALTCGRQVHALKHKDPKQVRARFTLPVVLTFFVRQVRTFLGNLKNVFLLDMHHFLLSSQTFLSPWHTPVFAFQAPKLVSTQ